jgi:hypothetical protein
METDEATGEQKWIPQDEKAAGEHDKVFNRSVLGMK